MRRSDILYGRKLLPPLNFVLVVCGTYIRTLAVELQMMTKLYSHSYSRIAIARLHGSQGSTHQEVKRHFVNNKVLFFPDLQLSIPFSYPSSSSIVVVEVLPPWEIQNEGSKASTSDILTYLHIQLGEFYPPPKLSNNASKSTSIADQFALRLLVLNYEDLTGRNVNYQFTYQLFQVCAQTFFTLFLSIWINAYWFRLGASFFLIAPNTCMSGRVYRTWGGEHLVTLIGQNKPTKIKEQKKALWSIYPD